MDGSVVKLSEGCAHETAAELEAEAKAAAEAKLKAAAKAQAEADKTAAEAKAKADQAVAEAKAKAVVEHVRQLEDLGDARTLTALCRQA